MKIKLIHTPMPIEAIESGKFRDVTELEKFFADNLQTPDNLNGLDGFQYFEMETSDLTPEQIKWMCLGRVQTVWKEQPQFYPASDYYNFWVWVDKGSGYEFFWQCYPNS